MTALRCLLTAAGPSTQDRQGCQPDPPPGATRSTISLVLRQRSEALGEESVGAVSCIQGRWVAAGKLEPGDLLLLADGSTGSVTQVGSRLDLLRVHNLPVAGIHTFYVALGDSSVLVHNAGCTNIADLLSSAIRIRTTNGTWAFQRLRDNHGVTRIEFRSQIHKIKKAAGLEPIST